MSGSFVLARLEDKAAERGINYVYNTIRAPHQDSADLVHDWLVVRGFRGTRPQGDTTLRKRVGSDGSAAPARRRDLAGRARPVRHGRAAYDPGRRG